MCKMSPGHFRAVLNDSPKQKSPTLLNYLWLALFLKEFLKEPCTELRFKQRLEVQGKTLLALWTVSQMSWIEYGSRSKD